MGSSCDRRSGGADYYSNWNTGIDIRACRDGAVIKAPDPIWPNQQLWPRTQAMCGRGEFYRDKALQLQEPVFHFALGGGLKH